jgi:DNA (cytosine-5)-methyltransferase 1
MVNVLDLFCGAGGFSLGLSLSESDFNIVAGLDNTQDAIQTFNNNHSNNPGTTVDISTINPDDFADTIHSSIDVIIGGPPCKGFSSIRPNRSSDEIDYRNYLYQDYLDFVDYFEPDIFVIENVPEIINHTINGTKIISRIESEIESLGYSFEWKLLNSAYYGVPQARTRFILIATNHSANSIQFPTPTHTFTDQTVESNRVRYTDALIQPTESVKLPPVRTVADAISDLPALEPGETYNNYNTPPQNEFQEEMRSDTTELRRHTCTNHSNSTMWVIEVAGQFITDIPEEHRPSSGYNSTYSRLYIDEPSTTLTTHYTTAGSTRCIHPTENRAITVREGMRIQSFPDNYHFIGTKSSVTKQVGNAVPPLLGKQIGNTIGDLLSNS